MGSSLSLRCPCLPLRGRPRRAAVAGCRSAGSSAHVSTCWRRSGSRIRGCGWRVRRRRWSVRRARRARVLYPGRGRARRRIGSAGRIRARSVFRAFRTGAGLSSRSHGTILSAVRSHIARTGSGSHAAALASGISRGSRTRSGPGSRARSSACLGYCPAAAQENCRCQKYQSPLHVVSFHPVFGLKWPQSLGWKLAYARCPSTGDNREPRDRHRCCLPWAKARCGSAVEPRGRIVSSLQTRRNRR